MLSDLRFVCRALTSNRLFTLVTVLTLALGIGAAASIFSVTDWVLFRGMNYPKDVVVIGGTRPESAFMPFRLDCMARAYAERSDVMLGYSKAAFRTGNVAIGGQPVAPGWLGVSADFLRMLEVKPALGRTFLPGEDREGADHVAVVSHAFWKLYLGGSDDVLGRKLIVGDAVCTIVGVLREGQTLPPYFYNDVFRPLVYRVDPAQPWEPSLMLLGKLRPGVTRERAQQLLATVPVDLPPQMKPWLADDHVAVASLGEMNQFLRAEIHWVMVGAVGFLYAIACLNTSNLLLVRMLGQRRELSIRLALGGGRWRVIRLLALESATLAILASLVGLLVANWLFPLLLSVAGGGDRAPDWTTWTLGWRVVGVMGLLTLVTGLSIVVVPAARILRTDIYEGLKEGGAALGESPRLARLRGLFVVLQAAFAVILLTGAGLMIRTFSNLQKVDIGFEPSGRAKVMIGLPAGFPKAAEARLARMHEIEAALLRVPGVQAAGFGDDVLLPGYAYANLNLESPQGKSIKAGMVCVSRRFHDVAGLKLKRGRWLTQSMGNEIMVNESLARACWPGKDPVGQLLRSKEPNTSAGPDWKGWLVVGVVGDVRATMRDAPQNYVYGPEGWGLGSTFVVRLAGEYTDGVAGAIRRGLYAFDPQLVVYQTVPLNQAREQQLWAEKMANSVLKVLAGTALLLTVVGLFSVLAYTVDRRMGEFGVRMALGATRGDLMQLVLRRGLLLSLLGVGAGVAGSLALARALRTLLFGISPHNPVVLLLVGGLLLMASALGCLLPALRATRVDVTRLLRSE